MIFRPEETLGHVKHLSIKWGRILQRKPEDLFLSRYTNLQYPVERYADFHGNPSVCYICGYAMIRLQLDNGWTMDACSAMPPLRLDHPLLTKWQKKLTGEKLPTSCV